MQGSLFAKRVVFSFGNDCTRFVPCVGHTLNYHYFTRFSKDITKYRCRTLHSALQLGPHQPFRQLVRWSSNANTGSIAEEEPKKLSILQRFKKTYKEHGKVLVGVHVITSLMWYGFFYLTLSSGFDFPGYLETVNWNESVVKPLNFIGIEVSLERIEKFVHVLKTSGNYAGAYLMYKIVTPARYTVTIGGTNLAIKRLQRSGKIPKVRETDRLGHLMKESRVEIGTQVKKSVAHGKKRFRTLKAQRLGNKREGKLLVKAQQFYMKRNGTKTNVTQKQDKWLTKAREYYKNRKTQKKSSI